MASSRASSLEEGSSETLLGRTNKYYEEDLSNLLARNGQIRRNFRMSSVLAVVSWMFTGGLMFYILVLADRGCNLTVPQEIWCMLYFTYLRSLLTAVSSCQPPRRVPARRILLRA